MVRELLGSPCIDVNVMNHECNDVTPLLLAAMHGLLHSIFVNIRSFQVIYFPDDVTGRIFYRNMQEALCFQKGTVSVCDSVSLSVSWSQCPNSWNCNDVDKNFAPS